MDVLMLSWELPPFFSGGLGVACEGIANGLSDKVNLKVIVPRYLKDHEKSYSVIGLNNDEQEFKTSNYIPSRDCLSYHFQIDIKNEYMSFDETNDINSVLDKGSLYEDVSKKVREYTSKAIREGINQSFDVIYAHDWLTALAGIELQKQLNKPLVFHVHSLEFDRSGADVNSKGDTYEIERYTMSVADRVIVVSEYTATVCKFHYGIDPKKIVVVHNGVENNVLKSKPIEKSIRKEVVFLGRLTEQKGPYNFLEIAKKVLSENKDVRFTMAGTGEELGGLMEEGVKKELEGKVRFTGFLNKDEVTKLFSIADVYCMPSISEPFGLSALESVQQGVPVVISKQSGVSEVLSGAVSVDYWDTQKMADGINELLLDDDVYESKLELLSKDIEKLSWSNTVTKLKNVFDTLIEEN